MEMGRRGRAAFLAGAVVTVVATSGRAQGRPGEVDRYFDLDLGLGALSGDDLPLGSNLTGSPLSVGRGPGFGLQTGFVYGGRVVRVGLRYDYSAWNVDDRLVLSSSGGGRSIAFGEAGAAASSWGFGPQLRIVAVQTRLVSVDLGAGLLYRRLGVGDADANRVVWGGVQVGAQVGVMFRLASVSDWFTLYVGPSATADITLFADPSGAISTEAGPLSGSSLTDTRFGVMGLVRASFGVSRVPSPPPPPPPPAEDFVLVRASTRVEAANRQAPMVLDTPAHRRLLPQVGTVAVRAPGVCENLPPSTLRGVVAASTEMLHSVCAAEMTVVEERLARQGFRVISWTQLHGTGQEAHAAARRLGAQVIFQVHSLERTRGSLDLDFERRYEFHRSNARGEDLGLVGLLSPDRAALRSMMSLHAASVANRGRLGASLELTAHDVATGEVIWFFRWNHLLAGHGEDSAETLFHRIDLGPWRPVPGRVVAAPAPGDQARSEEVERGHEDAVPASVERVTEQQLVEELVDRAVVSYQPARLSAPSRRGRDDEAPVEPPPAAPAPPPVAAPPPVTAPPPVAVPDPEAPERQRRRHRRH